jgi:hypothetical protein
MTISNKHLKSSRLSEAKFRDLVMYFSADLDTHKVTFKTGLNRNTVNRVIPIKIKKPPLQTQTAF